MISGNFPKRYTIAAIEEAQRAYDRQCRELEERAAEKSQRLIEQRVRAATQQERERLEEALRAIGRDRQRAIQEIETNRREAVQLAATGYVQSRTRVLDVVMEGLKLAGVVLRVTGGRCLLQ